MKKILLMMLMALVAISVQAQPKREMRGAWIQCVNGQFLGMGTQKMQQHRAVEPLPDRTAGTGTVALLGSSAVDD